MFLGAKKMATLKRLEKRMNDVEAWVKDFNQGSGPAQTMDNLNWLVGQTRMLGDRLQEAEAALGNMQQGMQANNQIVSDFMESKDMVRDWQMHLEELQKEANAVQESETESLDVQEQAEDGEEVGEGDA
jgi:uncharacterized phage infection (PIP) family protein YhgE